MFGFNAYGLPVASTGEFPGFVNPMEPVTGGSDLVVVSDLDVETDGELRRMNLSVSAAGDPVGPNKKLFPGSE